MFAASFIARGSRHRLAHFPRLMNEMQGLQESIRVFDRQLRFHDITTLDQANALNHMKLGARPAQGWGENVKMPPCSGGVALGARRCLRGIKTCATTARWLRVGRRR